MAVLWISLAIVLLDQLTKFMIKGSPWSWLPWHGVPYGSSSKLVDDILRLTYIENPGIAFGINFPALKVFFSLFSVFAAIGITWYLYKNKHRLILAERIALAMILGGAVGNLIDRVFYGVLYGYGTLFHGLVVDFLDFGYKNNWWPVFNVADSAVSCGVVLLIILLLKKKPPVVEGPAEASFGDPGDRTTVSFSSHAPVSESDSTPANDYESEEETF